MDTIAALFVDAAGCYANLRGVDAWYISRDARLYAGPHPVVAHPPCQRWGKYWHGSPSKPHRFRKGEDAGCFAAALTAVRNYGGVLEHPHGSHAWPWFGLTTPPRAGGWVRADVFGGWTCRVDQGHYGHFSNKATWLYAVSTSKPADLIWGRGPQQLPEAMVQRYGLAKAKKIGVMAMVGGKDKTRIREATPPAFRDVLLAIARTCRNP